MCQATAFALQELVTEQELLIDLLTDAAHRGEANPFLKRSHALSATKVNDHDYRFIYPNKRYLTSVMLQSTRFLSLLVNLPSEAVTSAQSLLSEIAKSLI